MQCTTGLRFLNSLASDLHVNGWVKSLRDSLKILLPEVDRICVHVVSVGNILRNQYGTAPPMLRTIKALGGELRSAVMIYDTLNKEDSGDEFLLQFFKDAGAAIHEYQKPYFCKYHYRDREIGNIILLQKLGHPPLSGRTLQTMEALRPFLSWSFCDGIMRNEFGRQSSYINDEVPLITAENFTSQDRRVMSLLLFSHSYKAVAESMNISVDTVKKHARRVYTRLGVRGLPDLWGRITEQFYKEMEEDAAESDVV